MGILAILEDELIKSADDTNVSDLDAGGKVIKNSANPVDDNDLTTMKWVQDKFDALPRSFFDFEIPKDFPDLQTALASVLVQAGATLYVTDHPDLATTVLINKANLYIIFKNDVVINKGGDIDIGIDVQADGVRIENLKIANFQQLDDIALRVGALTKNVRFINCDFIDNYEAFQDLSEYTIEYGNAIQEINFVAPTILTYDDPQEFIVDQPITPYGPTAVDATIAQYIATGLPPGLSINQFTGVISGTPTVVGWRSD